MGGEGRGTRGFRVWGPDRLISRGQGGRGEGGGGSWRGGCGKSRLPSRGDSGSRGARRSWK